MRAKPENQHTTGQPLVWSITSSDNILLLDTDFNLDIKLIMYSLTLKCVEHQVHHVPLPPNIQSKRI
jgi:hypothetical protein